ncbi:MAG: PaaI family thioesterase [Actinobacteria bacterium]|nr:PaaI family thioesterase [Actinomycetota bacterium]MBU1942556.1 PaaI family thioesterase [Actinomycetota bacterium]MBU2687199.1 PaaI family thioesterase [Actinomycetota bacterium]
MRSDEIAMPPPCDRTMGFDIEVMKDGYTRWTWTIVDDRFDNPVGNVLGGFLAVFADELMGSAMATTVEEGETFSSAELKINFLRPMRRGKFIGEGSVTRRGRNISFLEAKITDEEGRLISTSTSTAVILRR